MLFPVMAGSSYTVPLLAGDAGTAQTVQLIREAVRRALQDPRIRATALGIVNSYGVRSFDTRGEIEAVFDWIVSNVPFRNDPNGHETIQDAAWTLQFGGGDCDDINAVLLPSLLGALGHRTRLVTIANDPSSPQEFTHVFAEVEINGEWIPLDAARMNPKFARGPGNWHRRQEWSLDEDLPPGLGDWGSRRNPGLGFDIEDLTNLIQTGITGAAQIIGVTRAEPRQLQPIVQTAAAAQAARGSYPGSAAITTPYGSAVGGFGGVSNVGLLIGGAALIVFAAWMFGGRR